jgi:glucose-1-phosphate adenylyltransferase
VVHTKSEERAPAHIAAGATIRNSLITNGTVISEGALVERSVLSPGTFVGPNAIVRESIILTDAYIEAGAVVERSILDKLTVVGHNARVGTLPKVGEFGITCVGKNAVIPAGYTIGHGCILGVDLREEDYGAYAADKIVPPNTSVGYIGKR